MTRANPLDGLDLDEFQTKPVDDKPKANREDIARMAAENGFPSRQAQVAQPVDIPAPKFVKKTQSKPANTERPRQHYFRTGRNKQINIKGSVECEAHLQRLVDEIDAPKGVVLEEALKALEAIKADVIARLDHEFPNRRTR
jgi:hypothetical protein